MSYIYLKVTCDFLLEGLYDLEFPINTLVLSMAVIIATYIPMLPKGILVDNERSCSKS